MPRQLVSSLARGIHHVFFLAACAACTTSRPSDLDHVVDTRWGVVRAAQLDDAIEVGLIVDRIAPQIATWVPECGTQALDICLVEELDREHWGGATFTNGNDRWIELPEKARGASAEAILAHELVHFWLGGQWRQLPPVLEEGLALYVSHEVVREAAARERGELALVLGTLLHGEVIFDGPAVRQGPDGPQLVTPWVRYTVHASIDLQELPRLSDVFDVDSDELAHSSDPDMRAVLDALAYVAVERIGPKHLYRLCVQSRTLGFDRIPGSWIWSAARINPDEPVSLERAAREMLGAAEIEALISSGRLRAVVTRPSASGTR